MIARGVVVADRAQDGRGIGKNLAQPGIEPRLDGTTRMGAAAVPGGVRSRGAGEEEGDAAETENGIPRNHRAATPPVSASGTALNTMAASRADPRAPRSRMKIRAKQTEAGSTAA